MYARAITLPKGDLLPALSIYVYKGKSGIPKDLVGALNVKFWMKDLRSPFALKINGAVAVLTATTPQGIVTYAWSGTNTDTPGRYATWCKVFYGASDTVPMTIIGPEIWIVDQGDALVT